MVLECFGHFPIIIRYLEADKLLILVCGLLVSLLLIFVSNIERSLLVTMNELILVHQRAFENVSIIGQGMKYLVWPFLMTQLVPGDAVDDIISGWRCCWSPQDNNWKLVNQGANSDLASSIREQILTWSLAHQNADPQTVNDTNRDWHPLSHLKLQNWSNFWLLTCQPHWLANSSGTSVRTCGWITDKIMKVRPSLKVQSNTTLFESKL